MNVRVCHDLDVAASYNNIGNVYDSLRDFEKALYVLQCRRRVISGQEFIPPYQKSSVQRSLHWPLLLVPALLTTHLLGFKDDLALKSPLLRSNARSADHAAGRNRRPCRRELPGRRGCAATRQGCWSPSVTCRCCEGLGSGGDPTARPPRPKTRKRHTSGRLPGKACGGWGPKATS